MVQVLTYTEGRVSVALIPDRLRALLAENLDVQRSKVAVIGDYLPVGLKMSEVAPDALIDRLTLLALPAHAGREEFLVRFQRGRAVWMVLVFGAEHFFDFDRRYIQPFLASLRASTATDELADSLLPSLKPPSP